MSIVPETLADAVQRLGNVDLRRIRMRPAPGTATVEDVIEIRDREKRLFELIDGILVEKAMGFRESLIAMALGRNLANHVSSLNAGVVVGADAMIRLARDTVRIPDLAFISWDRLPRGRVPHEAVPQVTPNLAVEVLSQSNTAGEMKLKREEYFQSGVDTVWEIDLDRRTIAVYTAAENFKLLTESDLLDGGSILPDFRLPLSQLFCELDRNG